jgi:peptide chain release factor 2
MDMKITTLDESSGDVVGYKSVELLVEGTNAYGWFKGEKGAHRLVRLSPFNANNKRQTTFAGVDVVPVLEEEELTEIDIPDKELEVTTMRSGGKGGQNVNKVETGVRIKHVPSGISVKCTQERSQGMNKSIALSRLKAQLLASAQEQQLQDFKAIRGDVVEASWGAQIRNYVMQPYKMVKDARGSSYETSEVDGVLDGGSVLEEFVGAWLRYVRTKEEKEREEMELEV